MQKRLTIQLTCITLLAAGCASLPDAACEASKSVRVYQAAHIDEQWIAFVWVEIPGSAAAGTHPGRLFVASSNPVGAIVPSMIELPCEPASASDGIVYLPAPVEIEFGDSGDFKTSYSWRSCSRCSECYMVWNFTLDLQGHPTEGFLDAEIVLNETFHSFPMKLVSLKMPEVTQACTQPRMNCRAGGACSEIKFESRQ